MLRAIYTYELSRLLRQPVTYIFFVVFFAIALLTMLGTGGFFDGVPDTDKEVRLLNSAHEINFIFQYFNKFFLFLLPAIIGMVIYKDFKNNAHPILFTFPIRKLDYLLGKFLSALTVVFLVTSSIGIAFYLGELILGREHPMVGPPNFGGYASAYLFFVLPNMFMYGLFVFVVVASLRNMYAGFIAVIVLLFLQIIMDNLFAGDSFLFALFDPLGQNAAAYEIRFWTISEQNERPIPILGTVLWNRMLWISLSLVIFGLFYRKFKMEQETFRLFPGIIKKRKHTDATIHNAPGTAYHGANARIEFSFRHQLKAMLQLSTIDFRFIIKSWIFHVLVLLGMMAVVFAVSRVTNRGDMTFLPLTRIVLSVPMLFFSMVIVLLTFIYSGMLVHRSRTAKANQLIDATATSNWVIMGSKVLALLQVQILLLFVMMLCGIGLQLYNGYYHFEIGLYLFHLFILTFPSLLIWAVISVFVHTMLPNVYLGIFLLLVLWLGVDQLPQVGIDSYLLRFNSPPQLTYSDMVGFGSALSANLLVNAYWMAFSGLVIVLTHLFWERGLYFSIKERLQTAVQRISSFVSYPFALLLLLFIFLGFEIYKEENSPLKSAGNNVKILDDFRANFGKYKAATQPKITSVKLNMELFPETQSFKTNGSYQLVNKSLQNIDTLLIKTGYDEITEYSLGAPSRLIQKDEEMQFALHVMEESLLPGDSLRMRFEIKNKPNTLFYQNSNVLQNGTFLKTDILPRLGYFFDKDSRAPTDSLAKYLNFYASDADLVEVETVISTNQFQTAVAPGSLQNHWTENGRNFFRYKTEEKIKFALAFNSGVFSIHKVNHKGVDLEIYHHENHPYNLRDMTEGLKAALDYNNYYFGPYQHDEVRVIEFPHTEGSYATVMGNSIPTSEVRFVLQNRDVNNQVNLSFYVQAHELTHQWWGNQVVPADALGAKMLTESITEYISLRIYERYFGREKALHFLSLQHQRYLEGRTREPGQENPLYLVQPDQEYIAYGKGAMALNTLQYHIGENELNGTLKTFLNEYKFRTDRYPTAIDLIAHLKKSISPEFHYIISDMMESITFYDHKINGAKRLSPKKLEVSIHVKKMDHTLNNELNAHGVFIDIGQYDEEGQLIHIDNYNVSSGENRITISQKPKVKSIVLDPHLHFIELDIENNRKELVKKKKSNFVQ